MILENEKEIILEIKHILQYGVRKDLQNEIKIKRKNLESKGKYKGDIKLKKLLTLDGLLQDYTYALSYADRSPDISVDMDTIDNHLFCLKRCLKQGKKILKMRIPKNSLDILGLFSHYTIADYIDYYVLDHYEDEKPFAETNEIYTISKNVPELIKKSNSLIKKEIKRLKRLKKNKKLLEKKGNVKNNNIGNQIDQNEIVEEKSVETAEIIKTGKIKNLRIYGKVKLTKKKISKESNKFESFKMKPIYDDFSEKYKKSLSLMNKFVIPGYLNDDNIIYYMEELRRTVAETIAEYLDARKTKYDIINPGYDEFTWIISSYESAYKIFVKQMKKMKKADRQRIINEYNKKNKRYPFNMEDYNTESMLEIANNLLINKMVENKQLYSRKEQPNTDYLSATGLILERATYMTLDKVGEAYGRIYNEYKNSTIDPEYYTYDLQQNFIYAIYELMKKQKMISKDQKCTKQLQQEICKKYLNSPLFEKSEENEKGKSM